MKIVGPHGNEISSLEDWSKLHSDVHWKEGSSAYSVADFYVIVFKTPLFDQSIADDNHRDFQTFINRVGSTSYELPKLEAHAIEVDNRQLTCIYEQIEFPAVAT